MTDKQHVHMLRRHTYKTGNTVYFCMLPDCRYKVQTALALGKRSICHRCGEPFIMNEYAIRLAKPHCQNCHKPKFPPAIQAIDWGKAEPTTVEAEVVTKPKTIKDSTSDLKARLAGAVHGLQGSADDEEDI